ncbi:MAG: class II fumarate hydratase [Candidatus Thorarchaeota archaeon]|nr:class II fumarate hydratase [Candidatus Thorarchaeota archaeon]
MKKRRKESDSLGEVEIPQDAYWGATTQRAIGNFQISDQTMPETFILSLARVKKACALANMELKSLDAERGNAILQALDDIIVEKRFLTQFPVDVFQTGSGTQTNMNMNEVIANRANELLGQPLGTKSPVHPNDHVNMGQSSNDVIPTAMHLAVLVQLSDHLFPATEHLLDVLDQKIREFTGVIKVGRTHLQDAVPIPLSLEFEVYRHHIFAALSDIQTIRDDLAHVPIGGTILGTGLNAAPGFAESVVKHLQKITQLPIRTSSMKAAAIASHNLFVRLSGALRAMALACLKMANDIRWMGSGPRAGLGELHLPANEPGSSIMPGKINPTQAESMIQVCLRVMGNDATIALAEGFGSMLDLNVTKPLIITSILESIDILGNSQRSFADRCLLELQANTTRMKEMLDRSLMFVTRLAPVIGYDKAAEVAKEALRTGKTIRQVVSEMGLEIENIDDLLDPTEMV